MQPPSRPENPSFDWTLAHAHAVASSPERVPPAQVENDCTDDSNGDSNDEVGGEKSEKPYADS
jgi:hypothetical protein